MVPNGQATAVYGHVQSVYPTPPESRGIGRDHVTHANLLGLPTPPLHLDHHNSSSHQSGEATILTTISPVTGMEQSMAVSTSFYPGSHPLESDLVLRSTDEVHFYVHTDIINRVSQNTLPAFLSHAVPGLNGGVIPIPETGTILNILLHAIYDTSVARNSPTCVDLIEAVDKMRQYGLVPSVAIRPDTSLYQLFLTHAPLNAMAVYTLAAHHDIFELAKQASSHLLSFPLDAIDDATAVRMGPTYLKRLFLLHSNRMEAAKKIILDAPRYHPATKKCTFEDQKKVRRVWSLGATYLAWELRADLSTHRIKSALEPLIAELNCVDCQNMHNKRIRDVLVSIAALKRTI